jgi:transposase
MRRLHSTMLRSEYAFIMAPNLSRTRHTEIQYLIEEGFTDVAIGGALECSRNAVGHIRGNLRKFGCANARKRSGPCRSLTPALREALLEYLRVWPDRYLDELAIYLADEFDTLVSVSTISRELKRAGWSKKKNRQQARQRDPALQDLYLYTVSPMSAGQVFFVDESGCDPRHGFKRRGWSPLGVTPLQVARFQRGQRYHILPAYDQNGIIRSRVFQGSTNASVFEEFIEHLLPLCGRWPEDRSVLIIDNASFHHSQRVKDMCNATSVKLVYLPPYCPHLNPIKEFFAELKAFIKRH